MCVCVFRLCVREMNWCRLWAPPKEASLKVTPFCHFDGLRAPALKEQPGRTFWWSEVLCDSYHTLWHIHIDESEAKFMQKNEGRERMNVFNKKNETWILKSISILDDIHNSVCVCLCEEFTGRDRPRQLALNGSTTEYVLKNLVHDTEYVLSLYVLFGFVVGPGITATFRTCEWPETFFSWSTHSDTELHIGCSLILIYIMRPTPQHLSDTCRILK